MRKMFVRALLVTVLPLTMQASWDVERIKEEGKRECRCSEYKVGHSYRITEEYSTRISCRALIVKNLRNDVVGKENEFILLVEVFYKDGSVGIYLLDDNGESLDKSVKLHEEISN